MIYKLNRKSHINGGVSNGLLTTMARKDSNDYAKYKLGCCESISEDRLQHMEILSVLERLNFPMDEIGTYFFKDMIVKAVRYLDSRDDFGNYVSQDTLLQELKSPYSQFYFDLARNEKDIGVKTFHTCIENSLANINYNKADTTLLYEIYSNFSKNGNYGEHAYAISRYIKKARENKSGYQYTIVPTVNTQVGF